MTLFIVPTVHYCLVFVQKWAIWSTAAINDEYSLAIKAALAIGKKTLNHYYNKTDNSEVSRIAMGMRFLMILFFLNIFG